MAKSDSSRRRRLRASKGRRRTRRAERVPHRSDSGDLGGPNQGGGEAWRGRLLPLPALAHKEATKVAGPLQDLWRGLHIVYSVVSTAVVALEQQAADHDVAIALTLKRCALDRLSGASDQVERLLGAASARIPEVP